MNQTRLRYICNDNEGDKKNIRYMYNVPIVPAPIQRRRARVQELDELEEVLYVTNTKRD